MKEWTAEAVADSIPAITQGVNSELEALECSPQARRKINVALDELLSNIVNYAYAPGSGKMTVQMRYDETNRAVFLSFIDNGVPYDPLAKSDPDVTLSAEQRSIGGLGIFMVKKSMDDMVYEYKDGQNILSIKKAI